MEKNGFSKKIIYVVIGTRAQLIKMAPLMYFLQREKIDYEFIYTAQHKETISRILEDFHIKNPDQILYDKSEATTLTKFLGWGLAMLVKSFRPKKIFPTKGIVLTHGDTMTTAWSAFVGKLAGCKIGHVESGIRSFNIFKPFPEELMRLITFRFSNVYFCPNKWAVNNLKNYKGDKINLGLNPVYDSVKFALEANVKIEIPNKKYIVVSIHRFENIFTKKFEQTIIPLLEMIADQDFLLIFILHPSTRNVLKKNNMILYNRLENNKNITLKERYPYFEFLQLLKNSEFVITDGGSNQEELSYLGKPTLLFREVTERIEGLEDTTVLSHFNREKIKEFISNYETMQKPFLDVKNSPSKLIIDYLIKEIPSLKSNN